MFIALKITDSVHTLLDSVYAIRQWLSLNGLPLKANVTDSSVIDPGPKQVEGFLGSTTISNLDVQI